MRCFTLLAICAAFHTGWEHTVFAQPAPKNESPKVGLVYIIGNEITRDTVIRSRLQFYPGSSIRYPELRQAERELARLGIFEADKFRPTVTVLESDGAFKDILIQVRETNTASLRLQFSFSIQETLMLTLSLEERNFDPFRFPTHLGDFWEGRAFRGGGIHVQLPLLQLCLLPYRLWGASVWQRFLPSDWQRVTVLDAISRYPLYLANP